MKDKFIPCVSPLSLFVIALFDIASLVMTVFAVKGIIHRPNIYNIAFFVIMVVDIVTALLATKSLMKNGVRFKENEVEFTALDNNNIYAYNDIERADFYKDTKASLKKNFVSRYSSIIFYLKDGSVATVELGLTSKRKLRIIEEEIKKRIG